MRRLVLLTLFLTSLSYTYYVNAQDVINGGIFQREHVEARKPIPYYHMREADAMWSKKIWRTLDLREKMNQELYYPTEPLDSRRNLFQLLLDGIEEEGIIVYEYDYDEMSDEFSGAPRTLADIKMDLGGGERKIETPNLETGELEVKTITDEPKPEEIFRFNMSEEWVFDKQRSKMEIRIIGLAPFRWYIDDIAGLGEFDEGESTRKLKPLFWAYFNDFRPLFAQQEVFNAYNDAERRTFEDIFLKRRFSSHIYKITNKHNNRAIKSYKKGEDALLEAERIESWVSKVEQDFWEF